MTPPRKRLPENRGLPARWVLKHGAYYYRVPVGLEYLWDNKKWYPLGHSLAESYHVWAERMAIDGAELRTVANLIDRYLLEIVPMKAPKSQESNRISLNRLRRAFGVMMVHAVRPIHVHQYMDKVARESGRTSANRDLEVFRHAFSMAVTWGVIDRNPIKGQVSRLPVPPRDRLVEDWEIKEVLKAATPIIHTYIRFKLMTGLRRGDILRLRLSNLRDDGIHVTTSKTGKRLVFIWDKDGELQTLVDEILCIPPRRIGDAPLFTTRQGKAYIDSDGNANGFDSLWQRFMRKALEKTDLHERFQERDLRAKVASDSASLLEASERLGHADTGITQRVYRRKPVRVSPLIHTVKD